MLPTTVKKLLAVGSELKDITVKGWIRTRRDSKACSFAELNDGSARENLQLVFSAENGEFSPVLPRLLTGAAVAVTGDLVAAPAGARQKWELRVKKAEIYGECDPEKYPIQKKKVSDEFLRTVAHLRPRTNKYASMLRVRSELALRYIPISATTAFSTYTRPLSPVPTAKARASCFRSQALTFQIQPPCLKQRKGI